MGSMPMATYALPKSHQDVSLNGPQILCYFTLLTILQLMEKSLVELDPEVAEIMVQASIYSTNDDMD